MVDEDENVDVVNNDVVAGLTELAPGRTPL